MTAASIIASQPPASYEPWDAAVRAAKAATLRDPEAAAAAEQVLRALPRAALDGAAQSLLVELGYEVEVDGEFGPASQAVLAQLEADRRRDLPEDSIERLKAMAQLRWEETTFRVDLY